MYCSNCGREAASEAKFCEACGTALRPGRAGHAFESPPAPARDDSVLRAHPPILPPADLPFRMQEGEHILKAFRPLPRTIVRFSAGGIVAAILLFVLLFVPSRSSREP